MANERFSIVEDMNWTHGKVSMYGTLQPILDNAPNIYDTVLVDKANLAGEVTSLDAPNHPIRAVVNNSYIPVDGGPSNVPTGITSPFTVHEIYEWDGTSTDIPDGDNFIVPDDLDNGDGTFGDGRWIKANDKYLFAYDYARIKSIGTNPNNANVQSDLSPTLFQNCKTIIDICENIWVDNTSMTDWPTLSQVRIELNKLYQQDDYYGNNKTVRLYWEFIANLLDTEADYNKIDDDGSGNSKMLFEPHISLKKNQELAVYFSPMVDLRTPVKDIVNIFDPGTSNSMVYYRGILTPPKLTPDYKAESEAEDAALLPDKYIWRPDTFMHPIENNLVHTWPLHYEDTYLEDVQSGRHAEIPINTILLRKSETMGVTSEWDSVSITDMDVFVKNILTETDITDDLNYTAGSFKPTLNHIPYYHWVFPKLISDKNSVMSAPSSIFSYNDDINPFTKNSSLSDNLETYIPQPQSKRDLLVKMHHPQLPDLNGHLLNYYDDYGFNRDQYMIFNDVFRVYPDITKGKNGFELNKLVDDTHEYATDLLSGGLDLNAMGTIDTEIFDDTSGTYYLAVTKQDFDKYFNYLSKMYYIDDATMSKIKTSISDNDTLVIPKSVMRMDENKLNTTLYPSRPPTGLTNFVFKTNYEDDKLTGYLDVGSFERQPLSTGDGNISLAFSLRNIDGGTILSTGGESSNETGIYVSLDKQYNDHEHPIDPFQWGLNVIIKSTNFEYKLENLNWYRNGDMTSEEYEEYKRLGFGLFRPVPSIQRLPTLTYNTSTTNLGVAHKMKELTDAADGLSKFEEGKEGKWFGDYFEYSASTSGTDPHIATLKETWKTSYLPSIGLDFYKQTKPSIGDIPTMYQKTNILDWSKFNWTNILITKKEEIEYCKVSKTLTDKLDFEPILDEEGNKITNYLDANIWLLNHIDDAIEEVNDWTGDITVRSKTKEEDGTGNIIYDNEVINRMDVYASYKHDDGKIDYVLLGSVDGISKEYQEGNNTNLFIGRANDNSKPYYVGHLKDLGVWYDHFNIVDRMVDVLINTKSIYKMINSTKTVVTDEITVRNVLSDPEHSGTIYRIIKYEDDGTTEWLIGKDGTKIDLNSSISETILTQNSYFIFNGDSLFTLLNNPNTNGISFTDVMDLIRYSKIQYIIDYNRQQYLSDLAMNVKTTKWTKYPFLISYNPSNNPTQLNKANLNWYNRNSEDFSPVTFPKEKILNIKGYRGWQSKILLKL